MTIAATGLVALIDAVMTFAVVAPLPNAAASIMSVAIILAVISLVVMILRNIAAVAIVAVMRVVPGPVVIPGNPAAVQYVALVVVAVLPEHAVASPGTSAVMIGSAMTLQRKSVAEMEMATHALMNRPAVVTSGAVWQANVVTRAYAKHLKDARVA